MLEKMDVFFENRLSGYDEHMLSEIYGAEDFYRFTAERLPTAAHCSVLDLGCGTGLELEYYLALNPTAEITGIDLSRGMLSALKSKFPGKDIELVCGSYFDISLNNEAYDAAVSVESLHHFTPERKLALYKKLQRALKTNGYFILTDYFAESEELEKEHFENLRRLKTEQGITDDDFYHYDTPLTVEHEIRVLRAAGFAKVEALRNWGATYSLEASKKNDDNRVQLKIIKKGGTLRFWGEWFGRPYDNFHIPVGAELAGDILTIRFKNGEKCTVYDPSEIVNEPNDFHIARASKIVWEWYCYGKEHTPKNLCRREYENSASGTDAKNHALELC